jgi:hypothetical protein
MMGAESYSELHRISYQVQQELDKLEQPERPKRRGKKLRLPKESGYDDPGAGSSCVESD